MEQRFGWHNIKPSLFLVVSFVLLSALTQKTSIAAQADTTVLDKAPISLNQTVASIGFTEEGLRAVVETVKRLEYSVRGVYLEVNRQQTLVMQNPYYLDPFVMDPFMQYGFDYSIDPDPMWTCNTGEVLPPRRQKLANSMSQIEADISILCSQVNSTAPPDSNVQLKVQWEVLVDTMRRMQEHCQWLQSLIQNDSSDRSLLSEAAEKIRDDAQGVDNIAQNIFAALAKGKG